ncbi:PTS sugar transporter subunit IIB [Enterococcus asini]|uniref:PTS sugar transporter subunit IIB n=1 Tax=Enterococcus asini TaxID=57732 RepID=UPI00288E90A4|nr:PTS sugar transporter subunit IIB [Enterococcus asini]MDT2757168.1 PTS sugar transporter subunit IIB [Enterococcus asini]
MIKLLRIDDRLIHGQVAMAWTKSIAADHIIVVDDPSASDKMKMMILTLAKPASTGLDIVSLSDFKSVYEANKQKNVMIVTSSPRNAFEIVSVIGEPLSTINLGGLRYNDSKEKINEYIALTPEDKDYLQKLKENNYQLIMQATPNGKSKEF